MGLEAGFLRSASILFLPPAAQCNQNDLLSPRLFPHAASRFVAVQSWHPELGQRLDPLLLLLERSRARDRRGDLSRQELEKRAAAGRAWLGGERHTPLGIGSAKRASRSATTTASWRSSSVANGHGDTSSTAAIAGTAACPASIPHAPPA